MRIILSCQWGSARSVKRAFKSTALWSAVEDYGQRLSRYGGFEVQAGNKDFSDRERGSLLWICDRSREAKMLTSEKISEALDQVLQSGAQKLIVAIGGPDGISQEQCRAWNPQLRWSFGPLTLPHEIAAVVASEQLYRAFSIIKNHPYHLGH